MDVAKKRGREFSVRRLAGWEPEAVARLGT